MSGNTNPTLQPGYAFASSRRYPHEPDTEIVGDTECKVARFVGTARIDGSDMNAFRVDRGVKRARYYFQLASSPAGFYEPEKPGRRFAG